MRSRWFVVLVLMSMAAIVHADTKVTITITGLVTIADAPDGSSPMPKTFYILDTSNQGGSHVVQHIGVIVVHQDYTAQSLDGRKLRTEGKYNWVKLKGAEKLSVSGGSTTALDYSDAKPSSMCPDTTSAEYTSLYFFPRLKNVSRKTDGTLIDLNDLDTDYLKPSSTGSKVTAFMDMKFGSIKAKIVVPVVGAFKESQQSIGAIAQQMAAEKALWTFDITGDTLILQSSKDSGSPADFLKLHAKNGEIKLTIANAPDSPKRIGVKTLAETQKMTVATPEEHHFSLYYNFIKPDVLDANGKKYVRYIPVAAGVCNNTDFQTDPCLLRKFVDIPDPGNCGQIVQPLIGIGGINCGANGVP